MAREEPEPLEDDDDDALHWAGDELTGREGARLPSGRGSDAVAAPADDAPPAGPPPRPGMAPLTFLFAVLYLALTVGWILGTGFTSAGSTQLLPQVLWQFGEFTAIIAAPLWFGVTVLLTPWKLGARIAWLLLGVLVLLPWPVLPLLVTGGAS
ncbi:MAG: hypothetical protein KF727_02195 [Microbacteriaceae bacterium]|nr:hypothetical protein [Microbacteriaceae bacterium]